MKIYSIYIKETGFDAKGQTLFADNEEDALEKFIKIFPLLGDNRDWPDKQALINSIKEV